MSPGATFDRVYLALKEQLANGSFAPGDHLEPGSIGDSLHASITPVRDALHRLVGERLVDTPGHDGFRVPAPTEAELRDLYGWNEALLLVAVRRMRSRGRAGEDMAAAGQAPAGDAELFSAIARRTASREHEAAIEAMNDRLGGIRRAEAGLIADHEEELARLAATLLDGDLAGLRRGILAYHRRRRRVVGELLEAMRRSADPNNRRIRTL